MPAWKTFHAGAITGDDDAAKTAAHIAEQIEAPCVVKTPTGGSSVGVYMVSSQDGVKPAVEACLKFGPDILVEQMIEGREFTCAVLKDRALPSVEIVPKVDFYNYDFVDIVYIQSVKPYEGPKNIIPFYAFYKKIGIAENGNEIYAKTYVPAIRVSGYEEYFKSQEAEHRN
jgi:hypothetical protein